MLSRRNLRVKVMQTLYHYHLDDSITFPTLKNNLQNSIASSHKLYYYLLYLITKVEIVDNQIIIDLMNDEPFNKLIKKEKLASYIDQNVVKSLCNALKEKLTFPLNKGGRGVVNDDKDIILFFIKKIMLTNNSFQQHIEAYMPNWVYDKDMVIGSILKTIEIFPLNKGGQGVVTEDWIVNNELEDGKKFAFELLNKTIQDNDKYLALIKSKADNWDIDRIAVVDIILLKMALCELLYFKTIPVKVSINEYIDISKVYSTPKSNEFINGVLDKIMQQLKKEGKIVKSGRGLLEN